MRTCADSIDVNSLPPGCDLYAGYVDGKWANADAVAQKFPGKTVIRIAVFPTDNEGDCLDVEQGDATPDQAPAWVARRRQAGHQGPLVYCSESVWPQVRQAFQSQNVPEPGYWIAAYPGSAGAGNLYPGSVGHQWIDHGPYDESVFVDHLPGIDQENDMGFIVAYENAEWYVSADLDSRTHIADPADGGALVAAGAKQITLSAGTMAGIPDVTVRT